MRKALIFMAATACLGAASLPAIAQIKIGVILSATGPAASLGIPEKKTIELMPKEIGGKSIQYIVLDDATDTNQSVKAARKLMSDEKVDVVIGPSTSATSIAVLDVAAELRTPFVSMASSGRITSPMDEKRRWAFKTVMDESLMVEASLAHMSALKLKKVAFIGTSEAYGDVWLSEINRLRSKHGPELVATERYASADVTVLAQVAKVMATSPDAVLIAASGTAAALPHKTLRERGYKGLIFQTFGAAAPEVLKVGGKDMNGTVMASSAGFLPSQMKADDPLRIVSDAMNKRYEAAYGAGSWSPYASNAWSAWSLLSTALPSALNNAKPGTPEFRTAIRDQLEKIRDVVTPAGYVTMSPTDHMGFDLRSTGLYELKDGAWNRVSKH